jgi:hypothetical protein
LLPLLASIVALGAGPLIHELARGLRPALDVIDRVLFAIVVVLVLWKLLPHAIEDAGWIALAVTAVTWLVLFLADRALRTRANRADQAATWLALAGVAAHEAVDGVALATSGDAALSWTLVLHRLTVGLAVWLMIRQQHGRAVAIAGLAILAVVTVIGYLVGARLAEALEGQWAGFLQAAVAGALLHLAAHRHGHDDHGDHAGHSH